jgi:LEA14-like dessication related protein
MSSFSQRLALALTIAVALPLLPGCSAYQAYAEREAIRQAKFNFKSFSIDGVDLTGANVTITLELDNPTETEIALDRIDYVLFVNDLRAMSGSTTQAVRVPTHDSRALPIHATLRFRDVSQDVRNLLATRGRFTYRFEGTGHFDTPFGAIDYPISVAPVVSQ